MWLGIYSATKGLSFQHVSNGPFRLAFLPSFIFSGRDDSNSYSSENEGMSQFRTSNKSSLNGRTWANVLLVINVLFYTAQVANDGKLLFRGAKVNCYSLNSIGPTIEKLTGPRRFLAVYVVSAITSSATSYLLSRAPAVGASGAIFGPVIPTIVCIIIYDRYCVPSPKVSITGDILEACLVIGPAWRLESLLDKRKGRLVDKAPIKYLTNAALRRVERVLPPFVFVGANQYGPGLIGIMNHRIFGL